MPMDQSGPLQCTEDDPRGATGWQSPSNSTGKQTDGVDQVVAPTMALELV